MFFFFKSLKRLKIFIFTVKYYFRQNYVAPHTKLSCLKKNPLLCILQFLSELKSTIPFFNEVFVAARKLTTKRNKTGFILYSCDSPLLNSRVKNKTSLEFLFYIMFLLLQSKTLNKIYEKILYSVGFTLAALEFCAPN